MARRRQLRFFLDNCVPGSVGQVLMESGHHVIYQRDVIARDSKDQLVALASVENDAILVTFDKDYKAIASRFQVSHRRLRRLSRIDFTCSEPHAANASNWDSALSKPNGVWHLRQRIVRCLLVSGLRHSEQLVNCVQGINPNIIEQGVAAGEATCGPASSHRSFGLRFGRRRPRRPRDGSPDADRYRPVTPPGARGFFVAAHHPVTCW